MVMMMPNNINSKEEAASHSSSPTTKDDRTFLSQTTRFARRARRASIGASIGATPCWQQQHRQQEQPHPPAFKSFSHCASPHNKATREDCDDSTASGTTGSKELTLDEIFRPPQRLTGNCSGSSSTVNASRHSMMYHGSSGSISVLERAAAFEDLKSGSKSTTNMTMTASSFRMTRRASIGASVLPQREHDEVSLSSSPPKTVSTVIGSQHNNNDNKNCNERSMNLTELISTFEDYLTGSDEKPYNGYQPDLQDVNTAEIRNVFVPQKKQSSKKLTRKLPRNMQQLPKDNNNDDEDNKDAPRQRCQRRASICRGSSVELELSRCKRQQSILIVSPAKQNLRETTNDASFSSSEESLDLRSTLIKFGQDRSFRKNSSCRSLLSNASSSNMEPQHQQNVIETMAVSLTLDTTFQSSFRNEGSARIHAMRRPTTTKKQEKQEEPDETSSPSGQVEQPQGSERNNAELAKEIIPSVVNTLRPGLARGESFVQEDMLDQVQHGGLVSRDASKCSLEAERQRLGYEEMDTPNRTTVSSLRPGMTRGSSFGQEEENSAFCSGTTSELQGAERERPWNEEDRDSPATTFIGSLRPAMTRDSSFGHEEDDGAITAKLELEAERERLGYEDMDPSSAVSSLRPGLTRGSSFGHQDDDGSITAKHQLEADRQRLGYEDMEGPTKTIVSLLRPGMTRGSSFGHKGDDNEDTAAARSEIGSECLVYEDMEMIGGSSGANNLLSLEAERHRLGYEDFDYDAATSNPDSPGSMEDGSPGSDQYVAVKTGAGAESSRCLGVTESKPFVMGYEDICGPTSFARPDTMSREDKAEEELSSMCYNDKKSRKSPKLEDRSSVSKKAKKERKVGRRRSIATTSHVDLEISDVACEDWKAKCMGENSIKTADAQREKMKQNSKQATNEEGKIVKKQQNLLRKSTSQRKQCKDAFGDGNRGDSTSGDCDIAHVPENASKSTLTFLKKSSSLKGKGFDSVLDEAPGSGNRRDLLEKGGPRKLEKKGSKRWLLKKESSRRGKNLAEEDTYPGFESILPKYEHRSKRKLLKKGDSKRGGILMNMKDDPPAASTLSSGHNDRRKFLKKTVSWKKGQEMGTGVAKQERKGKQPSLVQKDKARAESLKRTPSQNSFGSNQQSRDEMLQFLAMMKVTANRESSNEVSAKQDKWKQEMNQFLDLLKSSAAKKKKKKARSRKENGSKSRKSRKDKPSRRNSIATAMNVTLEVWDVIDVSDKNEKVNKVASISPVTEKDVLNYCKGEVMYFLKKMQTELPLEEPLEPASKPAQSSSKGDVDEVLKKLQQAQTEAQTTMARISSNSKKRSKRRASIA